MAQDTTAQYGHVAQQRLFTALAAGAALDPGQGGVDRIETHISCVLLAGEHAYKVKKAVDLGFVDFTTLDSRHHACQEELRLNARLAPEVYLRVAAITGDPDTPVLDGDGPVLDYAVVMQRFPQTALLNRMLEAGSLTAAHIAELGGRIARFHEAIPAAPADAVYGSPDAVRRRVNENLEALPELMPDRPDQLESLRQWSESHMKALEETIERRRLEGRVRECHGDLHLENIIYWRGRIMAFDGIEFDPDLRWIDVASEIAFLTMDLDDRGAGRFACQLRNDYLEATGDYDALRVLGFYQVYRALVRAKINALQAGQRTDGASQLLGAARAYLDLAQAYTKPHAPALVLMHGVSGTGKSTLTQALINGRGFIRLRSDVVRKRLFGLQERESSHAAGLDIYTAEASRRTYERMAELARDVLDSGYSVVLDATFLRREHRAPFLHLAESAGVPWHIVSLQGDPAVLRERVHRRQAAGGDASEADAAVLEHQLAESESLSDAERAHATTLDITDIPEDWHRHLPG